MMTSKELQTLFDKYALELSVDPNVFGDRDNLYTSIFLKMFQTFPHRGTFLYEGSYLNKKFAKKQNILGTTTKLYTFDGDIDAYTTFLNIIKKAKKLNIPYYIIRNDETPIVIMENLFVYNYKGDMYFLHNSDKVPSFILKSVAVYKEEDDVPVCYYVTYGKNGYETITIPVKHNDTNITLNYNDDLPDKEIKEFINTDNESGLIILHGEPGAGKTTYIRHLISSTTNKDFLILDQSTFNSITESSFIELLYEYKDSIIILEDCESMLTDRLDGNTKLASLLNLSDGILGDAFNMKFICTFNADIGRIDDALLRKGRMRIKYEFKKLSKDKVVNLTNHLNISIDNPNEMSLTDVYNYHIDNRAEISHKPIGF